MTDLPEMSFGAWRYAGSPGRANGSSGTSYERVCLWYSKPDSQPIL